MTGKPNKNRVKTIKKKGLGNLFYPMPLQKLVPHHLCLTERGSSRKKTCFGIPDYLERKTKNETKPTANVLTKASRWPSGEVVLFTNPRCKTYSLPLVLLLLLRVPPFSPRLNGAINMTKKKGRRKPAAHLEFPAGSHSSPGRILYEAFYFTLSYLQFSFDG